MLRDFERSLNTNFGPLDTMLCGPSHLLLWVASLEIHLVRFLDSTPSLQSEMSFESYQTRLFLLQYLINQLITSNNVYSKIKILRLFLVLLEEGHVEFKQTLRKTPEPFNEAASEWAGSVGCGW